MKTKSNYNRHIFFYITMSATMIVEKEITIDDVLKAYRSDVLDICKSIHGVDGYGNSLTKEKTTEKDKKDNVETESKKDVNETKENKQKEKVQE